MVDMQNVAYMNRFNHVQNIIKRTFDLILCNVSPCHLDLMRDTRLSNIMIKEMLTRDLSSPDNTPMAFYIRLKDTLSLPLSYSQVSEGVFPSSFRSYINLEISRTFMTVRIGWI